MLKYYDLTVLHIVQLLFQIEIFWFWFKKSKNLLLLLWAPKISGSNKQQVGMVASQIKSIRPPEPYKGKGIKEKGQYILRKEGKKK